MKDIFVKSALTQTEVEDKLV